ncbi:conserved hypothetical protein [Tenacibaculum finnmarkense genomovar ulcerans]|uniref:Uncharacterized protein n=1 Tax=Tenacibaculum finnmarkense genomovar ulcerans TaxID=2781388 RepID=A0A2I2MC13_9FLAO|nr:conserved hypothetical protein [Tenacibaculum finnmarkense genomovar ulcerans]
MINSNRTKGFWFSSTPVTSEKGSKVISNTNQSEILIKAIRETRHSKVSGSTQRKVGFSPEFVSMLKR